MIINTLHIVGASGAGTSTIAQTLEKEYNYKWLDTDSYYWEKTDPPYVKALPHSERVALMSAVMQRNPRWAISGSLCGWGDVFIPRFNLVVFIETPTDIRIDRLQKREYERFGSRILQGGDMYEEHLKFIEWASNYDTGGEDMRSRALHEKWLSGLQCPVIRIDGSKPVAEIMGQLNEFLLINTSIGE